MEAVLQDAGLEQDEIQVVAFQLGQEEYAVDIMDVQEIIRMLNVTRVPRTEQYIEGVINLRGNIIPLFNLHTRFNMTDLVGMEEKRIIVFQLDDQKAAIIVDEVSEVLRIAKKDIEETERVYGAIQADHIKGIAKVGDRLMILLDIYKILDIDKIR